jgi:plasmid stabilization system protein ParE
LIIDIENVPDKLAENPNIGRATSHRNIFSFGATKYNRIYFRVEKNQVTFLDLFESKTNPKRNKYE